MSISGALQTSITGLNGQSAAIGFISDNVANASTIGYKKVESRFQTLVTQSSAQANTHSPGGVINQPFFSNNTQGSIQQVSSTTSIALVGSGFIPVSKKNGTDGTTGLPTFETTSYFTRVGDFNQNSDGFLVNSSGYFLRGWPIDPVTGVVDSSATEEVRVSNLLDAPVATSVVDYAANLPSNALDTSGTLPATLPASSIQIFDALGNARTLNLTWTRTGNNAWELALNAPGADATASTTSFGPITVVFGGSIAGQNISPGTIASLGAADGTTPSGAGASALLGSAATAVNDDASISFSIDYGSGGQQIRLDLGSYGNSIGTTQYAGDTLTLNNFQQNGVPQGNFKNLAIDQDGFVSVTFDNGNVKQFYQIPVAKFRDPTELDRVAGNAFVETPSSGGAVLSQSGSSGAGDYVSAAIEGSNVDIAEEFSKLIVAQRTYSANARLITAADELLQETINIRR
ncbi:flagellar hook-basal body complex protein [Ferrovibrio terrae]|uniref:Flagellar hook protein FlgE n=1 Tax=Ferrovibrio terrae TaxID=2594003 RepID=A0A516GWG4_9PROT|nr:flagellar hook-basal body complex protein [Ferrovibrio terrae]QDO95873.1 flagellar hook-basal body complex protein [Ferrovibrio terrae]